MAAAVDAKSGVAGGVPAWRGPRPSRAERVHLPRPNFLDRGPLSEIWTKAQATPHNSIFVIIL